MVSRFASYYQVFLYLKLKFLLKELPYTLSMARGESSQLTFQDNIKITCWIVEIWNQPENGNFWNESDNNPQSFKMQKFGAENPLWFTLSPGGICKTFARTQSKHFQIMQKQIPLNFLWTGAGTLHLSRKGWNLELVASSFEDEKTPRLPPSSSQKCTD